MDTQDAGTGGNQATRRKKERHRTVPLTPEVRHFVAKGLEVRATADSDEIKITGRPIIYNVPYPVRDIFGEFEERMIPGCASDMLARGVDCRLLLNHEGLPMARTTAGTLRLWDTAEALNFEATLDARQQLAKDFSIAIERGDVSQMSVGMLVGRDEWGEDGGKETRDIYGLADLLDVSGVTYPCSPTTNIEIARRMALEIPVESRARARRIYTDLRAGKVLSQGNQDKVAAAAAALHSVLDAAGFDPQADDDDEQREDDAATEAETLEEATTRGVPATADERRALSTSFNDRQTAVYQALLGQFADDGDGDCDVWITDLGEDWVVYESYTDPAGQFCLSYTVDADGAVTLTGDPQKVTQVTTYEPTPDSTAETASSSTRSSRTLKFQLEARKRRRIAA
jgi:HK97 family phage prohead protease